MAILPSAKTSSSQKETPGWPAPLQRDAFYGLAGYFIDVVEPHSEADPAALLVQFLIGFGNVVGRGPHFIAGADQHFTNLFVVVVGATAKARKGMSWGPVRNVLGGVDPVWAEEHIKSGLASGEGLIAAFNTHDKRLLIFEPEFSRVLRTAERTGSTLSDVIRQAWDGGNLSVLTRNDPLDVKEPLISMAAHITAEELRSLLTEITALNGFANRYLWVCADRSKSLPDGDSPPEDEIESLIGALGTQLEIARAVGFMQRDPTARELWHEVYPRLTDGNRGRFGAATARAEAQVMRLACIYALLDGTGEIGVEHLKAGLAVWRYCEDSARFIFGDSLGSPIGDRILKALRDHGSVGMSRTDISDLFRRNVGKPQIDAGLVLLEKSGLARAGHVRETIGQRKPTERWYAV